MRTLLLTPLFLGSLLVLGCSQESPAPDEERVESDEAPIINGSPDLTHTAVVAVLGPNFACTGTVLQVKGTIGYVLTAAHCCPANALPKQVVIGPNYNTGVSHPVVAGSVVKDSCYQDYPGSTDDVCMLRFANAAGVPVIPPMTPQTDNLTIGTPITYVGYGITVAPPGDNNSTRRYVDKTIGKVDPYFVEYASAGVSGTCQGDSGGPGLVKVNGQEMVASVTSYGDQSCNQLGASARTSAVYTNFIAPYLADQAPNPICPAATDCNVCSNSATQQGACADVTSACFSDAECAALVNCYQGCVTQACVNACNTQNVGGLTKYAAIFTCVCDIACAPACGNTTTCTAPKCGLKVTDATCSDCVEASCCAEAWECQADTTCRKCFGATPPAACATNAKAQTYYQCAKSTCSCAVNDPANSGGTTAASSSAATTGSGDMTTTGAGGGGGATTSTGAGVGGGTAATTVGAGGAEAAGGSGSSSTEAGGCGSCTTRGSADHVPSAPIAALGLGALAAIARRRRRVG
jgi:MYXO-CTERM domain-containing protein